LKYQLNFGHGRAIAPPPVPAERDFARLSRVEPNDRLTLRGEGEAFRLAIQIAEPPCI
jgi:hypothetical protein